MPTNWLPIDDFSAGIWSPLGPNQNSTSGFKGGLQAPHGAMQMADTFGCAPGFNGKGLVPLPGQPTVKTLDLALCSTAPTSAPYIAGQEIVDGSYEYIFLTFLSVASNSNFVVIGNPSVSASDWLVQQAGPIAVSGPSPTTVTTAQSRMNPTTPYLTPGEPVVAYGGWFSDGQQGLTPHVTPNPTAPGNNRLELFATTAWVLGHQNRVVLLERTAYTRVTARGEQISFTDPANSNVVPATPQRQVFYPEYASGYGAWGSLSASQLLLIKRSGGGVLLSGDIAAPQTTFLPGVTSTGAIVTKSAPTAIGVAYAAEGNGLWVWNGGAASEKLSRQLPNDFWYHGVVDASSFNTAECGPRVQTQQWGDYIVVSGAWLYHIPTGGWWRLFNPLGAIEPFMFASQVNASSGLGLRCARVRLNGTTGTRDYADEYATTTLTNAWSAHLHPIKVTNDTDVMVNEIVLEAQRDATATGTSTITLTLYNADGTTQALDAWTVTSSARPERKRFQCQSLGNFIEIKIVAANSSTAPAPILLSMTVGWESHNLTPNG